MSGGILAGALAYAIAMLGRAFYRYFKQRLKKPPTDRDT